jgi:uncharacterized membrane protein SirB2
MPAVTLYTLVKSAHLLSIALSLSLFTARWAGVLFGARWPMASAARHTSVMIDTVLLGAGITLWTLGNWHPWQHTWLGAKLALLVAYVLLGSWALKWAKSRVGKVAFGVLAVTVALHMVGIAAYHHPAGWYAPYLNSP